MAGWYIALIIYLIPILDGILDFEELEQEAKDWMRANGRWFPNLAPLMVLIEIALWPFLLCAGILGELVHRKR